MDLIFCWCWVAHLAGTETYVAISILVATGTWTLQKIYLHSFTWRCTPAPPPQSISGFSPRRSRASSANISQCSQMPRVPRQQHIFPASSSVNPGPLGNLLRHSVHFRCPKQHPPRYMDQMSRASMATTRGATTNSENEYNEALISICPSWLRRKTDRRSEWCQRSQCRCLGRSHCLRNPTLCIRVSGLCSDAIVRVFGWRLIIDSHVERCRLKYLRRDGPFHTCSSPTAPSLAETCPKQTTRCTSFDMIGTSRRRYRHQTAALRRVSGPSSRLPPLFVALVADGRLPAKPLGLSVPDRRPMCWYTVTFPTSRLSWQ